jgi:ketosteroid isomerase-like protein
MSQDNVEIVRKPLRVRGRSSRTLDERLLVRFPRLAAAYVPRVARFIDRLPPGSRLRQALVWRAMRGTMEAWNRRDLDVVLLGQHPDCEHRPPREFVEAGLWEPCYRGREGYRRLMAGWSDVGTHGQLEPTELIDLGDRLVLLSTMSASSSHLGGAPLIRSYASVLALKDGRAISVTEYVDHAEALKAVGLPEQ